MSMKRFLVLSVLFTLAIGAQAKDNRSARKAECHQECFSCETRCRHSADYKSCVQTCLEIKRSCCQSCGAGPGPTSTCSCS